MDKGIIFSAAMVRALLDGRKTQTRRLCKPANVAALSYVVAMGDGWFGDEEGEVQFNTHFAPGDRLYVREACFATEMAEDGCDGVVFLADDEFVPISNEPSAGISWLKLFHYGQKVGESPSGMRGRGVPSIHMPRWASRLWLQVTDVRVQQVAAISRNDCYAEGIERPSGPMLGSEVCANDNARNAFRALWNSLHTKPGETWRDNPWVVAVSFECRRGNIDRIEP